MKKEIATIWIEALRSGDYKQTKDFLKADTGFCCLGVLCDLSNLSKWEKNNDGLNSRYYYAYDCLPDIVKSWAGMKSFNGEMFNGDLNRQSLSGLNDRGKSFNEIADIIEANIENL